MNGNDLPIDVDKLEKELVSALEADRRYSRENDAKFRAVNQKVATYEEFRDIVKASHLNPLDRDDITGRTKRKQPWNPLCSSDVSAGGGANHHSNDSNFNGSVQPKNVQEFMREWRRLKLSPRDQYQFLHQIGANHLYSLFRIEISMGVLGEMLEVLNLCYLDTDRDSVIQVLEELSKSSRFKLSLRFLGKSEREAAKELLDKLMRDSGVTSSSTDQQTSVLHDLSELYLSE